MIHDTHRCNGACEGRPGWMHACDCGYVWDCDECRPIYDLDPCCSICGQKMYRHPIVLWALQCLRCDRGIVWLD